VGGQQDVGKEVYEQEDVDDGVDVSGDRCRLKREHGQQGEHKFRSRQARECRRRCTWAQGVDVDVGVNKSVCMPEVQT
jgi:hypothetical protein